MSANASVTRVLVVGAGFSGMTAALEINRLGIHVDLLERNAHWDSYGAGISLHGATLRVFKRIGIIDKFHQYGAGSEDVDMRAADDDRILFRLPTPPAEAGLPGGGAVMRPVLAGILADAVRAAGIPIRLGQSFACMEQDERGVHVVFDDQSTGTYDLVIGADGLHSAVRKRFWPHAVAPRFIGQAIWRAVLPRPQGLDRPTMWIGGTLKAGVNPVSEKELYLFLAEKRPHNDYVALETFEATLKDLLAQFGSPILRRMRDELGPHSRIIYRPLEQFLLPRPWHSGRVVLIGDAIHATTPHLAAGACIGMEDGVALAEAIAQGGRSVDQALDAFEQRRWERCRMVVENSERLADIEINGGDHNEHAHIMRESMRQLAEPI